MAVEDHRVDGLLEGMEAIGLSDFTDDYIKDIKSILSRAQNSCYKAVNSVMIQAYWLVGYRIVEEEQQGKRRAAYGGKIIENLSKELNSHPGFGMSVAHLKNCRQFYLAFPAEKIRSTLCSFLSWSHLRLKYKTFLPTEEELEAELDRNRRYLEEKFKEH